MIREFVFTCSILFAVISGITALPVIEDHSGTVYLDINELNGTNPFLDDEVVLEITKLKSAEKLSVIIKRNKILADKSTAVWYGDNTYTGFGDISYKKSTIDQVPEGFPNFSMFLNYEEKLALVAFGNITHWKWEGFIGNSIIRYVSGNLYLLLDVTYPSSENLIEKTKKYKYSIANKLPVELNTERVQIIPEILVALDWKSVENKTARDVIKEVIVYYNAVDMLFSQFSSPSIQLNIAGIVIPKDSKSSPYFEKKSCSLEENDYFKECINYPSILDYLIRHFQKYNDVFLTKDYDIIMGMTSLPLCDANDVCDYYGTSFESGTCEDVNEDHYAPITGAVRHPHFQGNYFLTAREMGHILGSQYIAKWAHVCYGGIMSEIDHHQDLHQWGLDWSTCAILGISTHVRERENYTRCMWNLRSERPEPSTTTDMLTEEIPTITAIIDSDNITDTTYISSTPVDFTTELISTSLSNNTTMIMTSTTVPDEIITTFEPTTSTEESILTTKQSQNLKTIHSKDPVTLLIVQENTHGANNFIVTKPRNLKAIVGDVVHNIYNFMHKFVNNNI